MDPEATVLLGTQHVRLADRVRVRGEGHTVVSSQDLEVGADAQLANALVQHRAVLRNRALVQGDLVATTSELYDGAAVGGAMSQPLEPAATADWTIDEGRIGTEEVHLGVNEARALPPGDYGAVSVERAAALKLQAGRYSFRSLRVEPDGELILPETPGAVGVLVREDVTWRGQLSPASSGGAALTLTVLGHQVLLDRDFRGAILAPSATIRFAPRTHHRGAFFGARIDAEADVVIDAEAFPWASVPGFGEPSDADDPPILSEPPFVPEPDDEAFDDLPAPGPVLDGRLVFDTTPSDTRSLTVSLSALDPDATRSSVTYDDGRASIRVSRGPVEPPCDADLCLASDGHPLRDLSLSLEYRLEFVEIPGWQGLQLRLVRVELLDPSLDATAAADAPSPNGFIAPAGNCKERALMGDGPFPAGMPPVNFPEFEDCTEEQCELVARTWVQVHHNVWRLAQVFDFLRDNPDRRRDLWSSPAVRPDGTPLERAAPSHWFGSYDRERFDAIREGVKDYWSVVRKNKNGRVEVDLICDNGVRRTECLGGQWGGHWNKGSVVLCEKALTDEPGNSLAETAELRTLSTLQHELLHHIFVNYNGKQNLRDVITHWHGRPCWSRPDTDSAYYVGFFQRASDSLHEHFRDYSGCRHQRHLLLTVDAYAWYGNWLGRWLEEGSLQAWPAP